VRIRYNPLLPPPSQNPSLSVLSSAHVPSLFSLFAQKCVFASSLFPGTYSLFQKEDPGKSQQSKRLIHSFVKHPGASPFASERPLQQATIPFRITFFADPHHLTPIESHSYKNAGGGPTKARVGGVLGCGASEGLQNEGESDHADIECVEHCGEFCVV